MPQCGVRRGGSGIFSPLTSACRCHSQEKGWAAKGSSSAGSSGASTYDTRCSASHRTPWVDPHARHAKGMSRTQRRGREDEAPLALERRCRAAEAEGRMATSALWTKSGVWATLVAWFLINHVGHAGMLNTPLMDDGPPAGSAVAGWASFARLSPLLQERPGHDRHQSLGSPQQR